MINPKEFTRLQVIQSYLNGKSRDQIAREINISTGNVSNIIKGWKNEVRISNIEEIRDFVVLVKKSGISIEQCVQGYRMVNLMKNFGINDDEDEDLNNYNDGANNSNSNNHYNFSFFVNELYQNCKKFGVPPYIIPSWIKDLFDCYSLLNSDTKTTFFVDDDNALQRSQQPITQDSNLKSDVNIFSSQIPNKDSNITDLNPIISNEFNLEPYDTKEGQWTLDQMNYHHLFL